jgi:pullulanase/glycogen debranching enzyme
VHAGGLTLLHWQDNELNWFRWDIAATNPSAIGLQRFWRGLVALRREFGLLRGDRGLTDREVTWHGTEV